MTEKEPNRDLVAIKTKQQVLFVRGNLAALIGRRERNITSHKQRRRARPLTAHVDETFSNVLQCLAAGLSLISSSVGTLDPRTLMFGGFIRRE